MPRWATALAVLLNTIDLEVIAEGVETAEQLTLLRTIGVRKVQGYYISSPMRADAFLPYFSSHG